jgi:hypothetical protein
MAGTLRSALHPQRGRSVHETTVSPYGTNASHTKHEEASGHRRRPRAGTVGFAERDAIAQRAVRQIERVMPQITRLTWDNARVSVWPPRGDSV